jgi:hypothetical protein
VEDQEVDSMVLQEVVKDLVVLVEEALAAAVLEEVGRF